MNAIEQAQFEAGWDHDECRVQDYGYLDTDESVAAEFRDEDFESGMYDEGEAA